MERNNGHQSLTGQPTPLSNSLEQLRNNALLTPMLKEYKDDEVDFNRHALTIDYSSNYWLVVIVLVVLNNKKFYWSIQSLFISKASKESISLGLLTKKQHKTLAEINKQALSDCGDKLTLTCQRQKNSYFLTAELSLRDAEKLHPYLFELIEKEGE